jgi:hypothetical protein
MTKKEAARTKDEIAQLTFAKVEADKISRNASAQISALKEKLHEHEAEVALGALEEHEADSEDDSDVSMPPVPQGQQRQYAITDEVSAHAMSTVDRILAEGREQAPRSDAECIRSSSKTLVVFDVDQRRDWRLLEKIKVLPGHLDTRVRRSKKCWFLEFVDRIAAEQAIPKIRRSGKNADFSKGPGRNDGERSPVLEHLAPFKGEVGQWLGKEQVGWIWPDEPITHPMAHLHRGYVFVVKSDCHSALMEAKQRVTFNLYEDKRGLGAADVRCI